MTAIPTHPPPAPATTAARFIHGHPQLAEARHLAEMNIKRFAIEKVGRTGFRTVVDIGAGFSGIWRSHQLRTEPRNAGILFHAMAPISDLQDRGRNIVNAARKIPIVNRTAGGAPNPNRVNVCNHQLHECDCIVAANVQYTATNSAYYFQPRDWLKVTELSSVEHIVDHDQPHVPITNPEYKWERPSWFIRAVQFVTGVDDVKFTPLHAGGNVYEHASNEWVRTEGGKHIYPHSQKMYEVQHKIHAQLIRSPVATTIIASALITSAFHSNIALAALGAVALVRPSIKLYERCITPACTIHAFSDKTFGGEEVHTEVIKYIKVEGYSKLVVNRLAPTPPTLALQSAAEAAVLARKSATLDIRANQLRTIISTLARTYSVTPEMATSAVMNAVGTEQGITRRINNKLIRTYPNYLVGRVFEYSLNCVPSFTLKRLVKCVGAYASLLLLVAGYTCLSQLELQQPVCLKAMKLLSTPSIRSAVELSHAIVLQTRNLGVASLVSVLAFATVFQNAVVQCIMAWSHGILSVNQSNIPPYGSGGLVGLTRSVLSTLTSR